MKFWLDALLTSYVLLKTGYCNSYFDPVTLHLELALLFLKDHYYICTYSRFSWIHCVVVLALFYPAPDKAEFYALCKLLQVSQSIKTDRLERKQNEHIQKRKYLINMRGQHLIHNSKSNLQSTCTASLVNSITHTLVWAWGEKGQEMTGLAYKEHREHKVTKQQKNHSGPQVQNFNLKAIHLDRDNRIW